MHFEHARPALELVARQIPLVVKVIGSDPPAVPISGAEMRFVRWTAEREAEDVGDCHVGIMPLPDEEFARGKCGLKALQYMAVGRPVVASPVGVNATIIRHGDNGLLATTPQEFANAILQLARSPELRRKLGAAGRQTVEDAFSAKAVAAQFAEVIHTVTG